MLKTYVELSNELRYYGIQRCNLVCVLENVKQLLPLRSCTLLLYCLQSILDRAGLLVKRCVVSEDSEYTPL